MAEFELPDSLKIMIEDICDKQNSMGIKDALAHSKDINLVRLSEQCNVPRKYNDATFANTDCRLKDIALDFALHGKGVMIVCGNNGTGKTRLGSCCINERILREIAGGRYISCSYEVGPLIRSSRSFSAKKSEMDVYKEFYTTPFLVIDEAGKGDDVAVSKAFIRNVLLARYDYELPSFISMNGTKEEFMELVGNDVVSRLHETGKIYVLNEKDWRTQ